MAQTTSGAAQHCKTVILRGETMNKDVTVNFYGNGTVIVTENVDGDIYVIVAEYIQDILDDWNGECEFVPANDARVFFAAWNGEPINPHSYSDFESLVRG